MISREGGGRLDLSPSTAPETLHQINLGTFRNRLGQSGRDDAPVQRHRDPRIDRCLQPGMYTHQFLQQFARGGGLNLDHLAPRPDLNVYVESVNCSPEKPLRVKRTPLAVYVRTLNPGGSITDVNREDHLVWWAACVPAQAGIDPATLTTEARKRGYSNVLIEAMEVLKLPPR